jgi:hypothetical protein
MGYYKDRQKTQDLQNNMGYSEKWLFSTNHCFYCVNLFNYKGNLF